MYRSISGSHSLIIWLRVALKKAVVGDCGFDNLSGSLLQIQVNNVCQSGLLKVIGQTFSHDSIS